MTDEWSEWDDGEVGAVWRADASPIATAAAPTTAADPARRTVRLGIAAAVALVAAIVSLVVRVDDDRAAGSAGTDGSATSIPVLAATTLGPPDGSDLAAYIGQRHAALAAIGAGERRLAVVSLVSYRSAGAADELIRREAPDAEIFAHLVAPRGGSAERVDGDLAAWADSVRARVQPERDEIASLLPTVTDPEFVAFYEQELVRFDTVLAGLDPAGDLVFAVVVIADAGALNRLVARADVRLVDVAGLEEVATTTGVRPEELVLAGDPPYRP